MRQTTEIKPLWLKRSLSKNRQHSYKTKKQEVEQQEHKTVQNQRNIKKLSYELDLLKKMQIHSVFHVFMLQCCNQFISLQIIETFVESDEEYQVENILKKWMISENPLPCQMKEIQHLWKHMRTHRKPQGLHENTSTLWEEKVTRLNCQKLFDMLSKSWDKVSGWGFFSSSLLLLLIFFNRQRVFCLAQSWVWCNVLHNEKALQRGGLVLSQFEEFLTSACCEHSSMILMSHSHTNGLNEYTQHIWNVTSSSHRR
jgi:hypothetical protein